MRKFSFLTLALSIGLIGSAMAQTRPATPAVVAPIVGSPTSNGQMIPYVDKVNINTATVEQLDTLSGIGEPRAKAIIAGRPYVEKTDLVTKKIIPQSVFDGLKSNISLVGINKATAKDMTTILPGIGDARATAIVKGRPYKNPNELVSKNILTQGVLDGIKDMIGLQ